MAERLVDVGEVELCVETFGDAARPTVLLVSGAAASMDWWDTELCRRIADGGRHVVRYDHRDTGRSTTGPPGSPSYDGWQLGRDCAGLVGALDAGPVHLVGISMGGGIGQAIALQHPDLLASLTMVASAAAGGVDWTTLPGPSAEVTASFAAPPPDPDWDDVDSYVDWVVAGQVPFVGEIPLDEPRVRALAATVHARSIDPAAAANHWLVVGEGPRRQRRAAGRPPDHGADAGRARVGRPDVPSAPRPCPRRRRPGRRAARRPRHGTRGAAAPDVGPRRPRAAPAHGGLTGATGG